MVSFPKKMKIVPRPPVIQKVAAFLSIKRKESIADEQKFLPVNAT
jgi:hypothetical protein